MAAVGLYVAASEGVRHALVAGCALRDFLLITALDLAPVQSLL